MKTQVFNIALFILILAIPFALSSQTRKPIPKGRYEVLSGIKTSHMLKNENLERQDPYIGVWEEVSKAYPVDKIEIYYKKNAMVDTSSLVMVTNRNFHEIKMNQSLDLLITGRIDSAQSELLNLRKKEGMILYVSADPITQVMKQSIPYELIFYKMIKNDHFYLFRYK